MKYVQVRFKNYGTVYTYKTNLDLIEGASYNIIADGERVYSSPVTVLGIGSKNLSYFPDAKLRVITNAVCVDAPKRPSAGIKLVKFDEAKRITIVRWDDGTVTKVTCAENEPFDREKGLALCYMKRALDNRGCFNEVLKKYCSEDYTNEISTPSKQSAGTAIISKKMTVGKINLQF